MTAEAEIVYPLRISGDPTEEAWLRKIDELRAQNAKLRQQLELAKSIMHGLLGLERGSGEKALAFLQTDEEGEV